MATLSKADRNLLSDAQQAQVLEYKKQYENAKAAGATQSELDNIHALAEGVRASASSGGYSGGDSGSGYSKTPTVGWQGYEKETVKKQAAGQGGQSADEVEKWLEDYNATNYTPGVGWTNGYDTDVNVRSKANYVRQQMEANSKAWHGADEKTQEYLHQQNVELADLLERYNGGAKSTYDPVTGQWSTWNTNLGYGVNANWEQPNIYNAWKKYYEYTDEDRKKWDDDTSRYYNYVDTRVPYRNYADERSGYTGRYASAANGPDMLFMSSARGNLPINRSTGNHPVSDYTRQFAAYVDNGVIQPNALTMTRPAAGQNGAYSGVDPSERYVDASSNIDAAKSTFTPGTTDYNKSKPNPLSEGKLTDNLFSQIAMGAGSGGSYIDQMYDAMLKNQLEQLRLAYEQNVSDLDAGGTKVDQAYTEQKRQTDGQAAQDAANWREMANALGLNTGSMGQAALAMNNQTQINLNTLSSAQAAELAELERQRILLGQQYQSQINQAMAENDYQRAQALYQEAVRQEEMLMQQQQYQSQLALQYAQLAASQAAAQEKAKATATSDLQINPTPHPEEEEYGTGIAYAPWQVILRTARGYLENGDREALLGLWDKQYSKMSKDQVDEFEKLIDGTY